MSRTEPAPPVSGRRRRRHEATAEEIKQVARELMAREGTSSLNLRAVARSMEMTPSALYRYFPSRDAILTAMIVDAYEQLGDAVEGAIAAAPVDPTATAILAGAHAFRRWALDHPQEYSLTYGPPVPGYEPPVYEHTPAAMRTGSALLALLVRAMHQGLLQPPEDGAVPRPLHEALADIARIDRAALPVGAVALAMQFWVILLGMLSAEVFGHLPRPLLGCSREFFDLTVRQALLAMGVDPAAVAAGVSPSE